MFHCIDILNASVKIVINPCIGTMCAVGFSMNNKIRIYSFENQKNKFVSIRSKKFEFFGIV